MKKRMAFNFVLTFDDSLIEKITAFCDEQKIPNCCDEHPNHRVVLQLAHLAANELVRCLSVSIDVTQDGPGADGSPITAVASDGTSVSICLPKMSDAVALQ